MVKYSPSDGNEIIGGSYLGGTCVACGTVATEVTPLTGATSLQMSAEGEALYYQLGGTASTSSPGYIAKDCSAYIPPVDNLNLLSVIGKTADSIAHIIWFDEI